jgi:NADH-quinone oxidoreductase subunit B
MFSVQKLNAHVSAITKAMVIKLAKRISKFPPFTLAPKGGTSNLQFPMVKSDFGYNSKIEGEVIVTRADAVVNWVRSHSVWPMPMGLACCAIELMAAGGSRFDISRFGMEVMRFSPRQADCMIVSGTVTYKMAEVVRRIYDQMAEPKWVVAMGACASSGGMYRSYATLQGVDNIVPVDIYISGCPPRPEALLDGMMLLQEKIRQEGGSLKRTFRGRTVDTKIVS